MRKLIVIAMQGPATPGALPRLRGRRGRNPRGALPRLRGRRGRNPVECCLAWEAVVSKGHDVAYPYF